LITEYSKPLEQFLGIHFTHYISTCLLYTTA